MTDLALCSRARSILELVHDALSTILTLLCWLSCAAGGNYARLHVGPVPSARRGEASQAKPNDREPLAWLDRTNNDTGRELHIRGVRPTSPVLPAFAIQLR